MSRGSFNITKEFAHRLGADVGLVRSFWTQMFKDRNLRWLRDHHYLRNLSVEELSHVVPMVLHEDAAPVTKILSGNMISISSVLALGSQKWKQFLVATYIKKKKAESPDHNPLWKAILSDFEGLMNEDIAARGP